MTVQMNRPTDTLVDVRDLSVAFGRGEAKTCAVDRASFTIGRGETVALVGESGSGKTVSALSILRLLPYPAASHPTGEILLDGRNILAALETEMMQIRGDKISIIFQEPMTSLNPLHTIEKQVGEVLRVHHGMDDDAVTARVLDLLRKVGLRDPEKRLHAYPHQLSGGQRQRVMIAMALANEPDLLIADEPTTALDVTIQAQILELLKDLQREMHMAMLLITHDLGIVRKMAERVYVMKAGRGRRGRPHRGHLQRPQHPYTRHLLAAEPKGKPPGSDPSPPVVVETDDLKVWFPIKRGLLRRTVDHVKAVDGLSLKLRAGETLGVVGESGSGKTTLGLAILRLISSKGPIAYVGRRIDGLGTKQMRPLRKEMQIVFQDPYGSLSPRLSVAQIIEEGLLIQHPQMRSAERRERVAGALEEVGPRPRRDGPLPARVLRRPAPAHRHRPRHGAGAQVRDARRADERARHEVQAQIVDLLRDLQGKRPRLPVHQPRPQGRARACNYVMVLKNGRVVEEGPRPGDLHRAQGRLHARAARRRVRSHRGPSRVDRGLIGGSHERFRPGMSVGAGLLSAAVRHRKGAISFGAARMLSDAVQHSRFEATVAALSYWAPSVADVARVQEIETESCWRMKITPVDAAACPFELTLWHDGHYRLVIAGEVYDDRPIESFGVFVPMAEAIAAGAAFRRLWFSRLTGLPRGIGTVVEMGQGRTWSAERQLPGLPPADPEDVIARDRYFAPYRR